MANNATLDRPALDAALKGQSSTTTQKEKLMSKNKNEKMSEEIRYTIDKIINVANELQRTGRTGASTGERIAAAFVINCPEHLPEGYEDMIDAWDRLEPEWQKYVRYIKRECMFRIKAG